MKIALVTKQISTDDVQFIVHADGCGDVHKDVKRWAGIVDVYEAPNGVDAFVDAEIEALKAEHGAGSGWSRRQFKILPCTKGA
jgi:hypothetical protein